MALLIIMSAKDDKWSGTRSDTIVLNFARAWRLRRWLSLRVLRAGSDPPRLILLTMHVDYNHRKLEVIKFLFERYISNLHIRTVHRINLTARQDSEIQNVGHIGVGPEGLKSMTMDARLRSMATIIDITRGSTLEERQDTASLANTLPNDLNLVVHNLLVIHNFNRLGILISR